LNKLDKRNCYRASVPEGQHEDQPQDLSFGGYNQLKHKNKNKPFSSLPAVLLWQAGITRMESSASGRQKNPFNPMIKESATIRDNPRTKKYPLNNKTTKVRLLVGAPTTG